MKIGVAFFLFACLFFMALADSYGGERCVNNSFAIGNYQSKGVALGLAASQHNYDMGVNKFQGSVGLGTFQGVDAVSFSLGKRYKDILINGSIGSESGLTGYGAGITWRF